MSLVIVNYGMANLRSVQKAFERVGHAARVVSSAQEIASADRVVLPGVGAIGDALRTLRETHLDEAIVAHINRDRPFLGICLGLQMLFDMGHEGGAHRGLGVLRGECVRMDVDRTHRLKVPHMGWNALDFSKPTCPLLRGLIAGCHAYFVHGYHVVPADRAVIATTTDYGGAFVSTVWRDNLMATQFHPEKSQQVGLKMLENFATL